MSSESLDLGTASDEAFERALLGSAEVDVPPSGAAKRALSRFASAASNVIASGPQPFCQPPRKVRSVIEWLGLGMLAASAGIVGYAAGVQQRSIQASPSAPVVQPKPTTAPSVHATPSPEATPAWAPATQQSTGTERRAAAPREARVLERAQAQMPASAASLREEVARLDAARTALAIGDFDAVARTLERYRIDFPRGVLAREAELVAIGALMEKGDRDEARRRALRFLSAHPRDVHAARVKQLMATDLATVEGP